MKNNDIIYSRSLNGSLSTGNDIIGLAFIMWRAVEGFSSDWLSELPTGRAGHVQKNK